MALGSDDVILQEPHGSGQRRDSKDDDPQYVLPDPNDSSEASDESHESYLILSPFLLHSVLKINVNPRLVVSSNGSNILRFIPKVKVCSSMSIPPSLLSPTTHI